MAPIRRYLRISAYSVLEVRIYLDNPADAHRWLLHSSDPALPRIIRTIRPLVLPKLREENERRRRPGGGGSGSGGGGSTTSSSSKKKSVKDVVTGDDFDVSIFLTDLSTSHSLLTRAKVFAEKKDREGASRRRPVEIGDDDDDDDDGGDEDGGREEEEVVVPNLRREESDEDQKVNMADIPMVGESAATVEISDSADEEDGKDAGEVGGNATRRRRRRRGGGGGSGGANALPTAQPPEDDKKKLGFRTSYDGFRIYGKILCLVVKRKGGGAAGRSRQLAADSAGQAVMENWIASTQENPAVMMDDG